MLNILNLINVDVCKSDGSDLGALQDVVLDGITGKCLLLTEVGLHSADKITLSGSRIILTDARLISNETRRIVDKRVYRANGKYEGTVRNATLSKNLNLLTIVCDNGQCFTRKQLQAADDVIIIKLPKNKSAKKPAARANKSLTEFPARSAVKFSEISANATYPAKRRYGDFSFLLGKTVDKNITNFYNEIMIKRGERVTVDILRQAKISGKLIELCLHAK